MSDKRRVEKSEAQWREELPERVFEVTRRGGTEPPFSGEYCHSKSDGVYYCICCSTPLFEGATKFDSGTGWPSYWAPIAEDCLITRSDHSGGMLRQEVLCATCDAHLGHVFDDGPPPTGLRYCINSAALRLDENA